MTVTKKDIAKNISNNANISNEDGSKTLEIFLQLVKSNVYSKSVKLNKFGSFFFKKTPERVGRNPKTNETFKIASFARLVFQPSKQLKNTIN